MGTIAKSDGELVDASRRGEHEAFGHLVARYQDVVCAVSYVLLLLFLLATAWGRRTSSSAFATAIS